jgi:hypothetical protein
MIDKIVEAAGLEDTAGLLLEDDLGSGSSKPPGGGQSRHYPRAGDRHRGRYDQRVRVVGGNHGSDGCRRRPRFQHYLRQQRQQCSRRLHQRDHRYDFWDTGRGGGHFLVNGVTQPTNGDIYVTAAQLAQTTYQSGNGTDTLWVRANEGTQWSTWSPSFTVTAQTVDTPPVVTVSNSNITASPGQVFAASSLFTASDPDGDAITQYDFWDTGGGGGHYLVNGVIQPTSREIYVSAAQLAQTTYQSGNGTDTLWVRANDGTQWSTWSSSFTVAGQAGHTLLAAGDLGAQAMLVGHSH